MIDGGAIRPPAWAIPVGDMVWTGLIVGARCSWGAAEAGDFDVAGSFGVPTSPIEAEVADSKVVGGASRFLQGAGVERAI
jgi:hypothetical protein